MPITLTEASARLKLKLPYGWFANPSYVTNEIIIRDDHWRIVGGITRKEIDDLLIEARLAEIIKRNTIDVGNAKVPETD